MNDSNKISNDAQAPAGQVRRRHFVAGAGWLTAGGLAGLPQAALAAVPERGVPAGGTAASAAGMVRVGVLLPRSATYPELGVQWLAGARAQIATQALPVSLAVVEYGQRPSQAQAAAADWLQRGGVDVLAAFVCGKSAAEWAPLLQAHGVPLVATDAGANALALDAHTPWVVHNSLGYWQAAWSAGRWAARTLGKRALVAVAPSDSGFDLVPAFTLGLESAGGRVVASAFTHSAAGASQLDTLARRVRDKRADFVFALAAGRQAGDVARLWAQAGLATPLVAGGMLPDTMASVASAGPVWGVYTAAQEGVVASDATATPFGRLGAEAMLRIARGLATSEPAGMGEAPVQSHVHSLGAGRMVVHALPSAPVATCQGVCEVLGSRVTGTYLVA